MELNRPKLVAFMWNTAISSSRITLGVFRWNCTIKKARATTTMDTHLMAVTRLLPRYFFIIRSPYTSFVFIVANGGGGAHCDRRPNNHRKLYAFAQKKGGGEPRLPAAFRVQSSDNSSPAREGKSL